jgi:hypothetical protein
LFFPSRRRHKKKKEKKRKKRQISLFEVVLRKNGEANAVIRSQILQQKMKSISHS